MDESGQQDPPEATSNDTEDQFHQLPATNTVTIPESGTVNLTSPSAAAEAQDGVAHPELPQQQYPQAMSTLVPFLVQPALSQSSLPQPHQLNPNNMQMMIHNLLQPATAPSGGPSSQSTDSLQGSTNQPALVTENQPASMSAIQNLMRFSSSTTQQQGSSFTNFPHFNMLQNLITALPMQTQNVSAGSQLPDSSHQQTDASLMTSAAPTQEEPQGTTVPPPQQQNAAMTVPPSLNSTMGMINTSQTSVAQPPYPFQSLLKMNTNPVVPPGLWYPGAIYGGMVLGAQPPAQYGLTQPNPLVMQNLFTQMATHHHGAGAIAFPPTSGAVSSFNPTDPLTGASASGATTPMNHHHNPVMNADLSENAPKDRNGLPLPIYMEYDEETLTEYQCLLRKQIELFEAGPEDIKASAQGRNNPILLGQVGIRCRYCATLPLKSRPRGAVYYSKSIDGLYQVAQNMSKLHFCRTCKLIPKDTQQRLDHLQRVNRRAAGGKEYWAEGVRVLGVYEDGHVMRFRRTATSTRKNTQQEDGDNLEMSEEETTERRPQPEPQATLDDPRTGLTDDDDDDDKSPNTPPGER